MATGKRFTWLVSPKSFIQLVGAEYEILRKSGSNSLLRFYSAAVLIILILIVSGLSIFYATELLFHSYLLELLLSLFISVLFVFIYIFLINTFSKSIFKRVETPARKKRLITVSNIIRTGFVILMAFLISKPAEIFLFKKNLETQVVSYRDKLLHEYEKSVKRLNALDIDRLRAKLEFYQKQYNQKALISIKKDINSITSSIKELQNEELSDIKKASERIQRSQFLIYRIKRVCSKPTAWLICVGLIILFLLPGYIIYSISSGDAYYKLKMENEISIVMEEYKVFEKKYAMIFKDTYGLDLVWYSKYEDPPLNTKLKAVPSFEGQAAFLGKYSFADKNGL